MSSMHVYSAYGLDYESYKDKKENIEDTNGSEEYKKHLSSIGLTKEAVNNSGKHYILMDYTSSGNSLEGAYTMLTSDFFLGNDKRNITTAPIANVLCAINDNSNKRPSVLDNLDHGQFKDYAFVGYTGYDFSHTEMDWNINCFCEGRKKELITRKLFGFALMDYEFTSERKSISNMLIRELKEAP